MNTDNTPESFKFASLAMIEIIVNNKTYKYFTDAEKLEAIRDVVENFDFSNALYIKEN